MQDVFIIGSKGIPAKYGGFETFVDKLTANRISNDLKYHVACAVDDVSTKEFEYNHAHCFEISWRHLGSAKAVLYDIDAFKWVLNYVEINHVQKPIVYILACRIGPFFKRFVKKIHSFGGVVYVNPDGHEWKRSKWNSAIRCYWKLSERLMVKYADLIICDSKEIEKYIKAEYKHYCPNTIYVSYGTDIPLGSNNMSYELSQWFNQHGLKEKEYYLTVGRFVPENNYETIIAEFLASDTKKDLVLITDPSGTFYDHLKKTTGFGDDPRIKFVGTVYNQNLLTLIRRNAYANLHGHEVGGTNPSLLEALGATQLNLLLEVPFNREVAENTALYWTKNVGSLTALINKADKLQESQIEVYAEKTKKEMRARYSWQKICNQYEEIFASFFRN